MEKVSQSSMGAGSNMSVSIHRGAAGPGALTRSRRYYSAVKRGIDITIALTGLVVLSPLLLPDRGADQSLLARAGAVHAGADRL